LENSWGEIIATKTFVGVAGGIKDVTIGYVVAATAVYSYEFGKAGETFQTRPKSRDADYGLGQRTRAEARKWDWLQRLANVPDPAPKVFVGPIQIARKNAAGGYDLFVPSTWVP
jgi:hypothetical protein